MKHCNMTETILFLNEITKITLVNLNSILMFEFDEYFLILLKLLILWRQMILYNMVNKGNINIFYI